MAASRPVDGLKAGEAYRFRILHVSATSRYGMSRVYISHSKMPKEYRSTEVLYLDVRSFTNSSGAAHSTLPTLAVMLRS